MTDNYAGVFTSGNTPTINHLSTDAWVDSSHTTTAPVDTNGDSTAQRQASLTEQSTSDNSQQKVTNVAQTLSDRIEQAKRDLYLLGVNAHHGQLQDHAVDGAEDRVLDLITDLAAESTRLTADIERLVSEDIYALSAENARLRKVVGWSKEMLISSDVAIEKHSAYPHLLGALEALKEGDGE